MKKIYLLFLLTLLPLVASADAVEINGIYYNLYSSNGTRTASVTSNPNGNYSGFIAIPESVTYREVTYSVTSIRDWAFQNCSSLTSVTIPNSVMSIGYGAFSECSGLIFVDIPNSVTSIRDRAFQNCSSLTSVNIPNSVTSIGRGVFEGTAWYDNQPDGLVYAGLIAYKYKGEMPENTTLFIKEGTVGIADDAFSSCRGLTSVTIPNSVTFIGHSAFAVCGGLTSVSIPNGVTSIGTQAFMGCRSLTSITIPQSVTSIGLRSFEYCRSLESIVVESGNTVYDSRDNCDAIIETAKNSLITGCKMTVIPNSVTSIGSGAFLGCSGLTSVAIPNSVTSINSDAFADCSGLTSVTIPSSVAYIGVCAFGALASSYSMTSVTSLATTPPEMKDYSFPNYDIPLYVPKGTRDAYLAQESWNKFKEIIEIDNADEDEKKAYAVLNDNNTVLTFYYDDQKTARNGMDVGPFTSDSQGNVNSGWYNQRENITSVVFDASFADCTTLTSTAWWFYNFQNLSSITGISNLKTDNVTNMGGMFWGCSGLTSLDVTGFKTDNVTNMNAMFHMCSGLTSLDVTGFKTDKVTSMGMMFSGCSGLTSLDVTGFKTDNVTNMNAMFDGCSGLTSLDVTGFKTDNVTDMSGMFADCPSLTSLDMMGFKTDKVTNMSSMFSGCSSLTSLDVTGFKTDNVTYMSGMFRGCSSLTSLDVTGFKTDNVKRMDGMFAGCSSLTNLDVTGFKTENVTNMDGMFYNCFGLTSLDVTGFKTDNVTYMGGMFYGCSGLTSLDVTGFKTDNVTYMDWMFSGCSSLKTIYAGNGWSTAKVQDHGSMFKGCTSLVGGAGTIFNAIHTDHTYAHIDGGSSNPGYFTSKGATPVEEDVDEITIKDTGKTTWCSKYDLDFTNVEGVKAYTATGYDDVDKTIWLTRVMKVPAGTGILVKGNAGTYKIPHASVRAYYTNMFVGNLGETISIGETDGDKTNYYLKDGTFKSVNGNANIGKNKAYLQLPTSIFAGTRSIGISYDDEDGTTGIKDQSSKFNVQSDNAYYTLQGQRVVNPGKGLYIKNGKKVVIK